MDFGVNSSTVPNNFVRQPAYSFGSLNGTVCYSAVVRSSIEWVEYEYNMATQKAIWSEDENPEKGLLMNQNNIKDTLVKKLDEWSSMRMQHLASRPKSEMVIDMRLFPFEQITQIRPAGTRDELLDVLESFRKSNAVRFERQ